MVRSLANMEQTSDHSVDAAAGQVGGHTSDKRAGIIIIGDEILSGKFADENAHFLIGALAELGVTLSRIAIIPDDLDDIAETVRSFSARFDIVFTSGGIGPTHDDLTMAGVARAFGTGVTIHPRLETVLRAYWGDQMPAANIRLAQVPEGADLVEGGDGRWPVVCYRNVYILPGVPTLFRKKFLDIQERFRCPPILVARVFLSADEGLIAPSLDQIVATYPTIKIGSYPRFDEKEFQVIVTLESRDAELLAAATASLELAVGTWLVKTERP